MRSIHRLGSRSAAVLGRSALAVVALAALGPAATGQGAGPSPPLVLFDGKGLDGWTKTDFSHPGEVTVADGVLLLKAGRPMTGVTTSRRDLPTADYELRYEARRLTGNDFFAAATFPVGKSFATFVNGGWGGNVTGISSLDGMDAAENETNRYVKYQDQTWYRFRVRVTDVMIRCWIDDKEVVAVNHQDRKVGTRIETRANQPLGFATWESGGALRALALRRLTAAEIAETNTPRD